MTELLTDESRLVLAFVRDHPGLTIDEITKQLGMNSIVVADSMKQLLYHGVVLRVHAGRLDISNRYYSA